MRIDRYRILGGALCALAGFLLLGNSTEAGDKGSDSRVKVSAVAGAIDASGKQMVTVTLIVDKKWHIYANPVKWEGYENLQTVIKVNAGVKLAKVDIQYPAGKQYVDKQLPKEKMMVYEEKTDIPIIVQRAAGDVSPLKLDVTFNACDENTCLTTATKTIVLK